MLSNPDPQLWRQILRAIRVRNEVFRRTSFRPSSLHPGLSCFIHPLFLRIVRCSIYNLCIVFV
jgi:hypothetical protein